MATIQEKRNFLEHIKNETKHYEIRLEGVGCESVMGFITPQIYKYWNKKTDTELGSYVAEYRDINMLEKVPANAQLNREWYEYDDIAHVSGIVLNRDMTVGFNADTSPNLSWSFKALQKNITLKVGERNMGIARRLY